MLRSRGTGIILTALLLVSSVARAQTLEDIIAKNLEARGGVQRLKAITTIRIAGSVLQGGTTVQIVTWAKRPNMMRREMQPVPPPSVGATAGTMPPRNPALMKAVIAFDGSAVWTINPAVDSRPQQVTGAQADSARDDADFDSVLLDYKTKGNKVELVGTTQIDGKPTHHLKITRKNGQVQHYYLDAVTGLETRTAATIEQGGLKAEVTTDFSNYQTVDGLTMPFSMRQSVNGETVAQVTIEKWDINVPIDDQIFKMPGKQ